jgi:DNA uptake protein ComE-like DNA-binding protein
MPGAIGDASNVDLNSASQEELEQVGGLGQERARRIIQARPFNSWEDLKNKVEGFSDTLVNDLKQAGATIGGEQGKRAA